MISVCLASYNGADFIIPQIESILGQLSATDELIISDDGSTDSTISIVNSFNDIRIKTIQSAALGSPIFNFERALYEAKGDIIFLSDQDDVWLPNKVERILIALDCSQVVFSDAKVVDKDLNVIRDSFFYGSTILTGLFRNLFFNNYLGATMAFRRELLNVALPFPKGIPMHDQWLGVLGEIYFETKYIPEPLILYRRHGGNASFSGEKSKNSFFKKFFFRVSICYLLVKRIFKIKFIYDND